MALKTQRYELLVCVVAKNGSFGFLKSSVITNMIYKALLILLYLKVSFYYLNIDRASEWIFL